MDKPSDAPLTANFSVGGMPSVSKVSYPLPPDPHAPPGIGPQDDSPADYGLNEGTEVGSDASIASSEYGRNGVSPGGGNAENKGV